MTFPIQLAFHQMDRSEALEQAIRELAEKLGKFHPAITNVHVAVTQEARHSNKPRLFNVKLDVHITAPDEGTMPFYLSKDRAAEGERQRQGWTDVIRYLRETDPFDRLVTIHPSRTARASVTDPAVLDFDMQQTGHGAPAEHHAAQGREGWNTEPVMPVISGEARCGSPICKGPQLHRRGGREGGGLRSFPFL